MKTNVKRIISVFLAVLMSVSVLPLTVLQVSAADGDTPKVEILDYELNGNQFTITAQMTLSGGGVECYGFAYSINGRATEYDLTYKEIGKWEEFTTTITVNSGDTIWFEAIVRNEYGLEGKASDGFTVPEEDTEIELDAPKITAPDVDGPFYAGEDIKFTWTNVWEAEQFEWELYKLSKSGKYTKIDSGYTNKPVTIDGDTFRVGSTYTFQVRSCLGEAVSDWDCIYIYVEASVELSADPKSLVFSSDKGDAYFDLTSSHEWEADVPVSWINLSSYAGVGDEKITVYVEKNTSEYRTGVITITNEVGDSITIEVQQSKGVKSYLRVDPSQMSVSWEESYYSFSVESNVVDWEVYSDYDWIDSISNSSFDHNADIRFSVDENKSIEPRTGTITVTGGGITKTVTVTQDGRPAIVGDINNDGEITNKDRFLLNRYFAKMDGYTDIDKTLADINGDGSVNEADIEYLSRHLAGWVGYEKLPEINTGTTACAHTQYTDTYCDTVYVSSTIKTNTTHTYYQVYNRKCSCGADVGTVQGELITEAHSYVNNLCACGAYNNTSYEQWTGVNVSGAQANVYSTPSATVRYGYINKDEVVTVIGEYGDKYLIEYTLDGTGGVVRYALNTPNNVKQGYVNKTVITSLEVTERENLIKEIDTIYFDPRSQYEEYDDLAKNEISINFFDLVFADITDLGGVVEKCLDLGDADIVNSKHAIITLMDNMDDSVYVENTTECIDVIYALYDWIQKTPYDDIKSMFSGLKDQAKVIAAISDIKSMKIDNANNALSQGMEYLFACGLDNDAVIEKYAEILSIQLGNLDKKAALQKVKKAANTFGDVVGGVIDALDKIAKPMEAINAFYNIAIKDYTVEMTKLNILEAIFEEYRYTHLLIAVRELKAEMENEFNRTLTAAKKLAIEKALKYLLDKTNGLWAIISGAVEITVGQDAMAKRDACYILEMEDATYWYVKSLMYVYQEKGDRATIEKIKKALHVYTDCKTTLNVLAIELNTWGVFVTDKEKYNYLSIYKNWYSDQHDAIDALFVEFGLK